MPSSGPCIGDWRIALVETAAVETRFARQCLDAAERRIHDARRLASRRARWLAGRLAAKYLALEALEGGGRRRPTVLGSPDLERFAAAAYRAVGTVASTVGADTTGRPRLYGPDGRTLPWTLSISHAGGWTTACLAAASACGVDLEMVAPRRADFRRHNFTAGERVWAGDAGAFAAPPAADLDRRLTVLWTLKESVLKSGALPLGTLWDLPRLDLQLPDPPDLDRRDGFGRCIGLDVWAQVDRRAARRLTATVSAGRAAPPSVGEVILSAVMFDGRSTSCLDSQPT